MSNESSYHRLLKRQIRRFVPSELESALEPFFKSISDYYESVEQERRLLENTLDVSSKELEAVNKSLKKQYEELLEKEELRSARDEAIIAMNEAKEANRAKDIFLSNMSHELRTPLNAINGFSQILLAKSDTPEGAKKFIEKILLAGNNLLSLVNTILDFAKIESGKMEVELTTFVMEELLHEVEVLVEPMAHNKRLRLDLAITKAITLNADRQLIKQVLVNLLSNAIKFSPEGEVVSIRYQCDDNRCQFGIIDHGHGIEEEKIASLFDPFVQIREHQNESIKGTGLGLTIVKKIIEMHGGEIWVESVVGEGSRFYFSLPLSNGSVESA